MFQWEGRVRWVWRLLAVTDDCLEEETFREMRYAKMREREREKGVD